MEKKSFLVTELLCFFLGGLGAHRFYTGYVGLGVLQLLTAGGCGIWTLIDLICISLNKYKDANNNDLDEYIPGVGYGALAFLALCVVLYFLVLVLGIMAA